MLKLTADFEKSLQTFISDIIEKKEIYFFFENNDPKTLLASPSNTYHYEDEASFPMPVLPIWSPKYLPYAKVYGSGLSPQKNEHL